MLASGITDPGIQGLPSNDGLSKKLLDNNDSSQSTELNDSTNVDSKIEKNKATRADLVTLKFYDKENWLEEFCEVLFKVKERGSSIKLELYYGLIHFISCLYVLAVAPQQMIKADYKPLQTVTAVGLTSGVGCIVGGLFINLPFVLAPPTVISIFISVYLQSNGMGPAQGNAAVIYSGIALMALFYRPLGQFIAKLIPLPIQVGTALGVGMMTVLAGALEVKLVVPGDYTLLEFGPMTNEMIISLTGFVFICVALHYHVKGAFCIALITCSLLYFIVENDWPPSVYSKPTIEPLQYDSSHPNMIYLTLDLIFLYILYLNGLISAFSELADLKKEDGTTPRARWFYIVAGAATVISGLFSSVPILISPESSAGIKAGAKTGMSTVVCGILFILSVLVFAPLFEYVPAAGTSPLLMMVGVVLFQDVNRVNWRDIEDAAPAFVVLFFIPFTYSIINGISLGYLVYIIIGFFTGSLFIRFKEILFFYIPSARQWKFLKVPPLDDEASVLTDSKSYGSGFSSGGGGGSSTSVRESRRRSMSKTLDLECGMISGDVNNLSHLQFYNRESLRSIDHVSLSAR